MYTLTRPNRARLLQSRSSSPVPLLPHPVILLAPKCYYHLNSFVTLPNSFLRLPHKHLVLLAFVSSLSFTLTYSLILSFIPPFLLLLFHTTTSTAPYLYSRSARDPPSTPRNWSNSHSIPGWFPEQNTICENKNNPITTLAGQPKQRNN